LLATVSVTFWSPLRSETRFGAVTERAGSQKRGASVALEETRRRVDMSYT